MIEPTDLDWLALCLVTESNRPEEWPAIAQVIENRRGDRRWGNTYRAVILAVKQFSAFNDVSRARPSREIWRAVAKDQDTLLLLHAAEYIGKGFDHWTNDITRATLHYYSPVSMKPPGSKPPWAAQAKRLYTPPGIDPERFVFAEGVP